MKIRTLLLTVVTVAISSSVLEGQSRSILPKEAKKRLDYEVGEWRSKSENLDRNGNVTSTTYHRTQRRYAIPGRLIEIVGFGQDNTESFRAWVYYSMREKKYCHTSIDRNGSLMTMKGDLGPEFIWSGPMERPGGAGLLMRFTHTEIEENSFTALGEISTDGGTTWRAFSRQYLTRVEKESESE